MSTTLPQGVATLPYPSASWWSRGAAAGQRIRRSSALKLAAGAVLLAALYSATNWGQVWQALLGLDVAWFAAALLLFVPQTLLSTARWQWWVSPLCVIHLGTACKQVLAASAMNLVVPSKLGDLSKAMMLPLPEGKHRAEAGVRAAVEKASDLAALLALCCCGAYGAFLGEAVLGGVTGSVLLGVTVLAGAGMGFAAFLFAYWRAASGRTPRLLAQLATLFGSSWLLWFLHLAQIDFFLRSTGVFLPWHEVFARVPLAILVGLLPVSYCGIGARDSALVWLFADLAPPPALAVVGLLTALRYLVPGAAGIPALTQFLAGSRAAVPGEPCPSAMLIPRR